MINEYVKLVGEIEMRYEIETGDPICKLEPLELAKVDVRQSPQHAHYSGEIHTDRVWYLIELEGVSGSRNDSGNR